MEGNLHKYVLQMYISFKPLTSLEKLAYTIFVLYLKLIQHGLFSCGSSFFPRDQSVLLAFFMALSNFPIKPLTGRSKIILFTKKLTGDLASIRAFQP